MKNMKVKVKLITGFLIVAALAAVVGGVGIIGMSQIAEADTQMYNNNLIAIRAMGYMNDSTSALRMHFRTLLIYDAETTTFQDANRAIDEITNAFDTYMDNYKNTIVDQADRDRFDKITDLYNTVMLKQTIPNIRASALINDDAGTLAALEMTATEIAELDDLISESMEHNAGVAEDAVKSNEALFKTMAIVSVAVIAVAVVIAVLLGVYIAGLISKPMVFMKDILFEIGARGRVLFTEDEYKQAGTFAESKDEVGESIQMLINTGRRLESVGSVLEAVASGDLTAELMLLSEKDTIGLSLEKMTNNLNNMFREINTSTMQVATGSKQIADGSQSLAQGSTEQAAAVEQLSSSISEISEKTKENAVMASNASNLADTIKQNAEKGSMQMNQMMEAVKEINQASQSINKVIKVIDDIAFQTNILALNAAVEAARAGQHGKGFAVVAEEVRNLAAKSAEAAKDTGGLIANSMEKAELGARIADETAASLAEIVSGINQSSQIVSDIAKSSGEQSDGIAQVNKGINQVAQVVQQNSATAEESAAASEEMSGQANMLESLVAQFKLKSGGINRSLSTAVKTARNQLAMPKKVTRTHNDIGGDFGKY